MLPLEQSSHDIPRWEGAIVGLVSAVEEGVIPMDQVAREVAKTCIALIQAEILPNYGVLQTYLRQRGAPIQLVAEPFSAERLSQPGTECVDIITREPRTHWPMIFIGPRQAGAEPHLQHYRMSDEVNETILAKDTGRLVLPRAA
jgi:hypothetical protein